MKTALQWVLLGWLALVLAGAAAAEAPASPSDSDLTARQVLDRVDDLFRGRSSHGTMEMKIQTEHYTRTLGLEFWSEGQENSLVRILSPVKEQGTSTLRVGSEMWNYLPKVDRVIKIPSSMMTSAWMGSHFTNDDLVKDSRMAEDYTFELTFRGPRDGQQVIQITCTPKPDAPVEWGKAVVTVRASDYLPLRIEYYDEELKLARTMAFSDVRDLGGRELPARMVVQPAHEPNESTTVLYDRIAFDLDLPDDLFSLRSLRE